MFTKIFCEIKQNYTKNEHFIQLCSFILFDFIKKLQICKQTSKIVYSCKNIHATMYIKLAKSAECSSRHCKILYRERKLHIVIQISKQSSEKCAQQAEMVCNCIFSLFLSRILVVLFSSLRKEIYLHGSCHVKFYIATFQKKKKKKTRFVKRYFSTRNVDAVL